jgi:antitoxin CptB
MTDADDSALDARRKRAIFRSEHRGVKEMDLLMGSFARCHAPGFDAKALEAYEALLEVSDPDLYQWITGTEAPPPEHDHAVMAALCGHRFTAR